MWEAGEVPLETTSNGRWERKVAFKVGTFLNYRFTLGSWDSEALLQDGTVPLNHMLKVRGDTTVMIQVARWKQVDSQPKKASSEPCSVTFRVIPGTIPPDAEIYIVGNHYALGERQPGAVLLQSGTESVAKIGFNKLIEVVLRGKKSFMVISSAGRFFLIGASQVIQDLGKTVTVFRYYAGKIADLYP